MARRRKRLRHVLDQQFGEAKVGQAFSLPTFYQAIEACPCLRSQNTPTKCLHSDYMSSRVNVFHRRYEFAQTIQARIANHGGALAARRMPGARDPGGLSGPAASRLHHGSDDRLPPAGEESGAMRKAHR